MSERKVALVTHGMDALGTAICRRLQRDGFTVATTWPQRQRTPEAWLAAQRDEGFSFQAWCVDLGEHAECAALVGKLLAARGRLDVLVYRATAPDADTPAPALAALSQASWRATLRQALDGAFNISRQALVPMLEQRWGRIIQLASGPAWTVPQRRQAVSEAAANAGLHGLAKSLALEVARHGVTVNTVVPGHLRADCGVDGLERSTPALQASDPGAARAAALLQHIPVGRLGEPAEVAALVAWLASDSAAYVTGAQIAINGGQHMH